MSKPARINLILPFSTPWERGVALFLQAFFQRLFYGAGTVLLLLGVLIQSGLSADNAPIQFERSKLIIKANGKHHPFKVELADTSATRSRGLMERRHMDADAGMLFDFGSPRRISMWMKNTYLSLDMIFIDKTGKIIAIASNTTPLSLRVISHPRPALAVLEVVGGTTKRLNISVGDKVLHGLFQP